MKRHLGYALAVIRAVTGLISVDLHFMKKDPLRRETGRRAQLRACQPMSSQQTWAAVPFVYQPANSNLIQPFQTLHRLATSLAVSGSLTLDILAMDDLLPVLDECKSLLQLQVQYLKEVWVLLGCSSLQVRESKS